MIPSFLKTHVAGLCRIFCALLLLAALAACGQARLPFGGPDAATLNAMPTAALAREADQVYGRKDYARAEAYYSRLALRADQGKDARYQAYQRWAVSANESRRTAQARAALEGWADFSAKAVNTAQWQELYVRTLAAQGAWQRLDEHRSWLAGRKDLPWDARKAGAKAMFDAYADKGQRSTAMAMLGEAHRAAPDDRARAVLENEFLGRAREMKTGDLEKFAKEISAEERGRFPQAVLVFELAGRNAGKGEEWERAWRDMRSVLAGSELVDKNLMAQAMRRMEGELGVPRQGVALALPVTGRFGDIGRRIARGAGAAQWKLANAGIELEVVVVNTEAPGWIERLSALPSHFTVLGGPVRAEDFKELAAAGGLAVRPTFAFLPTLGESREGADAWRFFPSTRDQVRAVADLALDKLGIVKVAVLAPDEKFGRTMAELFGQETARRGGHVVSQTTYPPAEPTQWGRAVARAVSGGNPGAVFLPDGWAKAQALAPYFMFHEAGHVVLLGPELWSRSLDEGKENEEQYFRLAACPGAWWPETPGARELQAALDEQGLGPAELWSAVGYDFVRFAAFIAGRGGLGRDGLNARLAQVQGLEFSMAPLSFQADGTAVQQLYLFRPEKSGKSLVDPAVLREDIAKARERTARQASYAKNPGAKAAKPAPVPTPGAAPAPAKPGSDENDRD